jgi:DNA-binding beta-propeller fold protein YncE
MGLMRVLRLVLAFAVGLCALAGIALSAAPAFAFPAYPFERQLAPSGGSFGELESSSVAVNDFDGDTYVADSGSGAVDVFETSTGTQMASLDGSLTPAGSFGGEFSSGGHSVSIAANNATGMVYVLDTTHNVVDEFDSAGDYVCQITGSATPSASECNGPAGSATPAGGLNSRNAIAVDQATGEVYVLDQEDGVVDVFSVSGAYLSQISLAPLPEASSAKDIAVSDFNGDVYVSSNYPSVTVYVFGAAGEYLTSWNGSAGTNPPGTPEGSFGGSDGGLSSVAADNASGRVFVSLTIFSGGKPPVGVTDVFGSDGEYITQFSHGSEKPQGVAVDQASGKVYVSSYNPNVVDVFGEVTLPDVATELPTELKPTSVTLNGTVGPDAVQLSDCHFDYGASKSYGQVAPCVPAATSIPADSNEHAVSAAITGLSTDTTYYYRLQASNVNGTNTGEVTQEREFTTYGPGIHGLWASDVASTSATLSATIDPAGDPTTYYFQYGTSNAYGTDVPAAPGSALGSGDGDQGVSIHLQGLQSDTTYHYRVVAVGGLGVVVEGADHTFKTQLVGEGFELPDGRAWELVTPPDKNGNYPLVYEGFDLIQAASDGSGITYKTDEPLGEDPMGNATAGQTLSMRGAAGWRSRVVSEKLYLPPEGEPVGADLFATSEQWPIFSSDLSVGLLEPEAVATPESPEASERTLYLRDSATGAFTALETRADVLPGVKFRDEGMEELAATPDLSHVIFGSSVGLTAGAVAHIKEVKNSSPQNLYEWSAGVLQLVSILPNGEAESEEASLGSDEGRLGNSAGMTARAVSSDGRWVVWFHNGLQESLYVRDMLEGKTVQIGGGGPRFQTMSSDGSKIFYLENGDLYVFDTATDTQTDLTAGHGAGEPNAGVQDAVMGASEDGSYVYFVATGVLASGAVSGGDNVYVLHESGGEWTATYIATLSSEDVNSWGGEDLYKEGAELNHVSSRVSPDGRYLAFMSERSLTGYDNIDAVSGQPDEEVYLYDAGLNRVVCASCNPSGARPVGVFDHSINEENGVYLLLVDREGTWTKPGGYSVNASNHWLAGSVPGWDNVNKVTTYQPRYLSDSGRLFFNSPDALVPQATNGVEDVYEYEPAGVGSCASASVTFSERSGGCVSLISSGTSAEESVFMDASEDGDDVFFVTASKLTSEDYDNTYDIYDAHVCSAAVPCRAVALSPPPCSSGDSCKAAPSPQPTSFGPPPSATFSGTGNVIEEAKGAVKPKKAKHKAKPKPKRHVKKKGKAKRARRSRTGKTSEGGNR